MRFMFPYYSMKKTHFKKKRMTDYETKYECKFCDFITCNKSVYNRHLKTKKHEKLKMLETRFQPKIKKRKKRILEKMIFLFVGEDLRREVVCGNIKRIAKFGKFMN